MKPAVRLALYAALVLAVFGATFGAGRGLDPIGLADAEESAGHGGEAGEDHELPPGLAAADGEFRLEPATQVVAPATPTRFAFRVVGKDGPVRTFDVEHTKRMHLIVVRRDLTQFTHDHPAMEPDGTWATELTLDEPGAYRAFADFVVDGDKRTLAADVLVPGDFEPVAFPPEPAVEADAGDGYRVALEGAPVAGEESALAFTVRHEGRVVGDLAPYLGARGHLVVLRAGDLAYLHVHADEDALAFEATFPTAGDYALFLQFQAGGEVRTAAFTLHVEEAGR